MDWEVEGTKSQIKLTTLFGGLVWWPVGFEFNWYCKLPVLEVLLWENIGISSLVNDGQSWWTILFTITTLTTSVFANIYFRTQTFIVSWKFDHPTNPTFTRIPTVKQHPPPPTPPNLQDQVHSRHGGDGTGWHMLKLVWKKNGSHW